jgi:hypothetical protein
MNLTGLEVNEQSILSIWESYIYAIEIAFHVNTDRLSKFETLSREDMTNAERLRESMFGQEEDPRVNVILNMENQVRAMLYMTPLSEEQMDFLALSVGDYLRLRYNVGPVEQQRGAMGRVGDEVLERLGFISEEEHRRQIEMGDQEARRVAGGGEDAGGGGGGDGTPIISARNQARLIAQAIIAGGRRFGIFRPVPDGDDDPNDPVVAVVQWRNRSWYFKFSALVALLMAVYGVSKSIVEEKVKKWINEGEGEEEKKEGEGGGEGGGDGEGEGEGGGEGSGGVPTPVPPPPPTYEPTDKYPSDSPVSQEFFDKGFGQPYSEIIEKGRLPLDVLSDYQDRISVLSNALIQYRKFPNYVNLLENEIKLRYNQMNTFKDNQGINPMTFEVTKENMSLDQYDPISFKSEIGNAPDSVISATRADLLPMDKVSIQKYKRLGVLDEVREFNKVARSHNINMDGRKGVNDISKRNKDVAKLVELYTKIKRNFDYPPNLTMIDQNTVKEETAKGNFTKNISKLEKQYEETLKKFTDPKIATSNDEKKRYKLLLDSLTEKIVKLRERKSILEKESRGSMTYLDEDIPNERFPNPKNVEEGRQFYRIQQLENSLKENYPDIFRAYDSEWNNKDKKDYTSRLELIESKYRKYGIGIPEAETFDDDFSRVDFKEEKEEIVQTEQMERPSELIGGSALELATTENERKEEDINWGKYSLITDDIKLGDVNVNSLVKHNRNVYMKRFGNLDYVNKRIFKPCPKPKAPERQMPYIPLYPKKTRNFMDAYDNENFADLSTPLQYTSVDRGDIINDKNLYYPEIGLRKFQPKPTRVGYGPRRVDQQRFCGSDSSVMNYSKMDLFGKAGVPSDRWVYDNCRNFGVRRKLDECDLRLVRKNR